MAKKQSKENRAHWKARTLELEEILELSLRALTLIPIHDLERQHTWMPSEEALRLLARAQSSVKGYADEHWFGE